ncbi:PEPxxWA-CTERM sorting domain-containing protein [Sandarakinorhabdus sp. DWP1-3-1]|uniref:PEPxxWA-CTERM sorting domain-containing protein n=1 Tax=Sandarakinorhabdus sp. DWP1-3-1 TaxID=2804627 RepID=UPI003CF85F54
MLLRPIVGKLAIAALLGCGLGAPVQAVTVISSSAFGISANLTLLGFIGVGLGPLASVAGSATPAYSTTGTVASVDQTLSLGVPVLAAVNERVSTGVIDTSASSPYPTTPTSTATSTVNDLGLALTTKTILGSPINILTIGATTLSSTTSANAANTLGVTSLSNITGLTFSGLALGALTIDGSLFANAAPNTVILDVLGLRIIANEQITNGNGTDLLGRTTNALRVSFDNFIIGGGLLSGDVTVAHSRAEIVGLPLIDLGPIPEPSTWLQMIAGFGLVGVAARRRRPAYA